MQKYPWAPSAYPYCRDAHRNYLCLCSEFADCVACVWVYRYVCECRHTLAYGHVSVLEWLSLFYDLCILSVKERESINASVSCSVKLHSDNTQQKPAPLCVRICVWGPSSTISSARKRTVAPEPCTRPPVSSTVLLPSLCQLSEHLNNSACLQRHLPHLDVDIQHEGETLPPSEDSVGKMLL